MSFIYQQNKYVDIRAILNKGATYTFIVGGRGTGKTYSSLLTCYQDDIRFLYMRRTQKQLKTLSKPDYSPLKSIERDYNYNFEISRGADEDIATLSVDGNTCGYMAALNTMHNLRSVDLSDVEIVLFDEFIPEPGERPIKDEGEKFYNAMETIGRNRELQGAPPVRLLATANAFNIANPIFLELGLVGICEKLVIKKQSVFYDPARSLLIILLFDSEIMQAKSETALYKLVGKNSSYYQMAINNDFAYNPRDNINPMPLKEFKPLATVGEITIYRHKSKRLYYVSEHRTGEPPTYSTDTVGLKRYTRKFGLRLYDAYMKNYVKFENILTKSLFELYTI